MQNKPITVTIKSEIDMENNTDEIDVIELLRKCFSFIKKYKWILIITFFLGVVLGYYKAKQRSLPSNAYYRTQFIVKSDFLNSDYIYMEARDLAFNVIENNTSSNPLLEKINRLEIIINKIGDKEKGQEKEVNLAFETKEKIKVETLEELIISKLKSNLTFQENYELASDYLNKQNLILESIKEVTDSNNLKDVLTQIELLEKKQQIAFKIKRLKNPIQCLPIAPTNKFYPAPSFSILLVVIYGVILSVFSGLVIWFIRFIKKVLT